MLLKTGGRRHTAFRGVHAGLALLALLLFAAALRVRTWVEAAAGALALTVFSGHHAVTALWMEAYPVNHYLEVLVGVLATLATARGAYRAPLQVLILGLLAYELFLLESAVLIWVTLAAAVLAGLPGVRLRTLTAATLIVAVFLIIRFTLGVSAPGLGGNATGFGGAMLSSAQLEHLSGLGRIGMMAYNAVGAGLSVLLSEPRRGVFALLATGPGKTLEPVAQLNIAASVVATGLLIWCLAARPRAGEPAAAKEPLIAIAAALLLGTMMLGVSYIKDEILAVGAAGYALAVYVAARRAIVAPRTLLQAVLATAVLATAGTLWAARAAGVPYRLRVDAFKTRNDWARVPLTVTNDGVHDSQAEALLRRLRQEAVLRPTTAPEHLPRWAEHLWGEP